MNYIGRAMLIAALLATAAQAARINVGTHTLLPNTPGQIVEIYLEPSDPVDQVVSMDFAAVLPPLNLPPLPERWSMDDTSVHLPWFHEPASNEAGPVFMGFDISGPGTIFFNADTAIEASVEFPRLMMGSIITPPNVLVPGEGILARLTIDTTGVAGRIGEDLLFPLVLDFTDVPTVITPWRLPPEALPGPGGTINGFLRIEALPETDPEVILAEPNAHSLAGLGGTILAIGVYVLRRRRLALN